MNYISLFSGGGVGCFGFKQEGFDGIATSELLERRLNVQKVNNKLKYDEGYILGDITQNEVKKQLFNAINLFKEKENVDDVDVIMFTPPCQGMSVANHKKNDGTLYKNSLVVEALEIVKKVKPKFFIAENVRAFMNTKCVDHNFEKKIKEAFKDWLSEDYIYEDKIINFKDYGANSSRTRTLVIGVRKDLKNKAELIYKKEAVRSKKFLRKFNNENRNGYTEVLTGEYIGPASQIHHIFPESQFPFISHEYENLVALSPSQHYLCAHPNNNTGLIDKEYQIIILNEKNERIKENIEDNNVETIYSFDNMVKVINEGFKTDFETLNNTYSTVKSILTEISV